ncbi:methyltransferase domain-containing protein [Parasphingorhabdus sp.]|uniref:methyltransferase domain-containing protein n=1 Tax=Parasphingorhabdus sp. TaxID=2709688 RepID=UPI003A95B594
MIRKLAKRVYWSSRKLRLPIGAGDSVLEVGSGGNPHPYADILLEKFIDNGHRLRSVKLDRQAVLADACQMPFRTGSFDYSLAYHVLEHVKEPEKFLSELMRVSKAGYIETPNVFYERLHPFDVHVTEVALSKNKLLIRNKSDAVHDAFLSSLDVFQDNKQWRQFFSLHPEAFHVCLKWQGHIDFERVDQDLSLDWFNDPPAGFVEQGEMDNNSHGGGSNANSLVGGLARKWKSSRNKKPIRLDDILVCPLTKSDLVYSKNDSAYISEQAELAYPIINNVPVMLVDHAKKI